MTDGDSLAGGGLGFGSLAGMLNSEEVCNTSVNGKCVRLSEAKGKTQ